MRSRDPSRCADEPDLLTALHGVTGGNEGLAHVEVARDHTDAMVDVHHVAGEKELVDQRDDAAIRRPDRLTNGAAKIDAEVATRELAVEHATRAESTRDDRGARANEWLGPARRRVVR